MRPIDVRPIEEMENEGYLEPCICYKSSNLSAKELTVFPGSTVTIKGEAA